MNFFNEHLVRVRAWKTRLSSLGSVCSWVASTRVRRKPERAVVGSPRVETTQRIGPGASRGDGMMIQNTTFLRRAVGSLLVALVTLVGFQAHAQLDFSVSTEITWNEDPAEQANNLTALNGRITESLSIRFYGQHVLHDIRCRGTGDSREFQRLSTGW